jgi:hypothetical protein
VSNRRRSDPTAEKTVHPKRGRSRAVRVFYVAVEGGVTEPDYLAYLDETFGEEHQFRIHREFRSKGLKPREVVDRVLKHRDEVGELWALFDRDNHEGIPEAFAAAGRKPRPSVPRSLRTTALHLRALRRQGTRITATPLRRDPSTDVWRLQVALGIVDD